MVQPPKILSNPSKTFKLRVNFKRDFTLLAAIGLAIVASLQAPQCAALSCSCNNTEIGEKAEPFDKLNKESISPYVEASLRVNFTDCNNDSLTCEVNTEGDDNDMKAVCKRLSMDEDNHMFIYKTCAVTSVNDAEGCTSTPDGNMKQCVCDSGDMCNEKDIATMTNAAESESGTDSTDDAANSTAIIAADDGTPNQGCPMWSGVPWSSIVFYSILGVVWQNAA